MQPDRTLPENKLSELINPGPNRCLTIDEQRHNQRVINEYHVRQDNIARAKYMSARTDYMRGEVAVGAYSLLIDDLLGDTSDIDLDSFILEKEAEYVSHEDILGFIYISLSNIGERKASGAYYTPYTVVNRLISQLTKVKTLAGKTVFDPCCGSGNFLLAIGDYVDSPALLYGQDIDPIAVKLARISFALKYGIEDFDFLCSHFTCADTLVAPTQADASFDIIIGNPPWGGDITKEQLLTLSTAYRTVAKKGTETYALFTERALSLLSENGVLAFVLPEAILNVSAHANIRSIVVEACNFQFVCYLGNVFSGVQCPAIILCVEKAKDRKAGVADVHIDGEHYSISTNRQISIERLNFHVKDEVQDCLDAMTGLSSCHTLLNNARFALGIVTGDNATYTSTECHEGYEIVLKGSDVKKYKFGTNGLYMQYIPGKFQQVAPTDIYRAPEKLLYRFICETLVFAYDDQQTLSLNSCNVLIPEIQNIATKYVLAVLNSRAANFFFIKMFHSVKVLRSHIEQIPIPPATIEEQGKIIALVDRLIYSYDDISDTYNELDDLIMALYKLRNAEKQTILSSLASRNLFLV